MSHKNSPQTFPAAGRRCVFNTSRADYRIRTGLSDAAGAHHRPLPAGRRVRHSRAFDRTTAIGAGCGQPFVIVNQPGGATNIATEAVVRAAPDGYTLLLVSPSNMINATLYDKLIPILHQSELTI